MIWGRIGCGGSSHPNRYASYLMSLFLDNEMVSIIQSTLSCGTFATERQRICKQRHCWLMSDGCSRKTQDDVWPGFIEEYDTVQLNTSPTQLQHQLCLRYAESNGNLYKEILLKFWWVTVNPGHKNAI